MASGKTLTIGQEKRWSMLAVSMSVFMSTLDSSIINISLPTLIIKLNTTFPTIQWVVLGYVLVITALMLVVARFGDILSKKRVLATGLIIFTAGSLLCGLSPSVKWLIAFRVLQGLGAVMMQAIGAAILVEVFPPSERGKAMGTIGSVISIGIALGPALGGIIIGTIGWRWIFLVNVPVGIITLFILSYFIPYRGPGDKNQSFDLLGAFILLITLTCFALGMTKGQDLGFQNSVVRILLMIFFIGLIMFILTEKKIKDPMIEMGLFRNLFFSISLLMSFLSFIAIGGFFLLTFFLQTVKHYPTQQVGFMMMVVPLLMGLFSPFAGRLSDRFGTRGVSLVGLVILFLGCLAVGTLDTGTSVIGYLLRVAPIGIGIGIFLSPNNSAIMGSVPFNRLGIASGLMALSRNLGQTTGMPVMGTVFMSIAFASSNALMDSDVMNASAQALINGICGAYNLAAFILLLAIIIDLIAFRMSRKTV